MWQPSASIATLKQRALVIDQLRAFFKSRHILEVETPLLSSTTATDPYITSIEVNNRQYLQTSPEFHMKRLLAVGSGPIFQITKAFRQDETSCRHHYEFTMLEWYRPGFGHFQLMDEIDQLLYQLAGFPPAQRISYQALFECHLAINPHQVELNVLAQLSRDQGIAIQGSVDKDDYLNLLFHHKIEPLLKQPSFVYDYPASQAALAKVNNGLAERFELYINGIELANGFHELCDHYQQRQRFDQDIAKRQVLGLPSVKADQQLLAALKQGLPPCAGVALGVDRLLMVMLKLDHISQILSFVEPC